MPHRDDPAFPAVILASGSPRRRSLLAAMGVEFQVVVSGVDEDSISAPSARERVERLAEAKADAVAEGLPKRWTRTLILAADTEVVLDGEVFGKPRDRAHAVAMLANLSGRTHEVITGLAMCIHPEGRKWLDAEHSEVTFHVLSQDQIDEYVRSGEADDKAGAYGIQGMGGSFIAGLKGELSNVIGLPISLLRKGMSRLLGSELPDALGRLTEAEILRKAFPEYREYR